MAAGDTFKCPSCGASLLDRVGSEPTAECRFCGTRVVVTQELRAAAPAAQAPPSVAAVIEQLARVSAEAQQALQVEMSPTSASGGSSVLGCLLVFIIVAAVGGVGVTASLRQERAEQRKRDVPVPLFERPLEASLPREVRCAGLTIQVNKGTITNRITGTANDRLRTDGERAYAVLRVAARNPLAGDSVFLSADALRLQLGDGRSCEETGHFQASFEPQTTQDATLTFQVPSDATWKGAKLVIAGADLEPAELPLDAPVPAPAYPVELAASGEARVTDGSMMDVSYQLAGGTIDLDSHGKRAEKGKRFLSLKLRVTNHSTFAGGFGLSGDNFRLLSEDLSLAPVKCPIELLSASSDREVEVVFAIPAGFSQGDLQVGEVGKQTARIPVAVGGGI